MRTGSMRRLILALAATAAMLLAFRPIVHAHDHHGEGSHEDRCAVCVHLASPTVLPSVVPAPIPPADVRSGVLCTRHATLVESETAIPRSRGPPASEA